MCGERRSLITLIFFFKLLHAHAAKDKPIIAVYDLDGTIFDSGQAFLIVVNNHTLQAMENVHVQLPKNALEWLGKNEAKKVTFTDKLGSKIQVTADRAALPDTGLILPTLPPNTPLYLEID